jgi:hypothetical protein
MTDRNQFEAMLEALINEDQETAKEIFHNIVVAKSREIYEELLESDFSENQDKGNPYAHEEEEEEEEEESDDSEAGEEDDSDEEGKEVGGDAGDDFVSDVDGEDDDAEGEEGEEGEEHGDMEDRVMDLEDALEDLKAEFEQLMADENHEPEHHDGMDDPSFGGEEPAGDEHGSELDHMGLMEYVNKVPSPKHGDNGTNTKSTVAGKNDMGGTTANIARGGSTTTGGTQGGLAKPSTTLQDGGNINKPGANAGKTAFKHKEPGHGAEKKGAKPGDMVGAGTGDLDRNGESNTKSIIGKKVR